MKRAGRLRPATEPPGWLWDGVDPVCPCQYGRCGYCHPQISQHRKCGSATGPPVEAPAAYLIGHGDRFDAIPVYEAGHRHRWICPCHETDHGRPATQLDLFALEAL